MAAGMHLARHAGRVGQRVLFLDVEGVQIGPQRDRPLAPSRPQRRHHPGSRETAMDLEAEARQMAGDELGGAMFLEGGFRIAMDLLTPGDHVLVEGGDPVDHGHGRLASWR